MKLGVIQISRWVLVDVVVWIIDHKAQRTALPHILQGKAIQCQCYQRFSLTSVTAKLLLPQGTTLYHLSCSTSINPCDLYWLISSDILEVSGELGGRPMPYPRRKIPSQMSFSLASFLRGCCYDLCDIASRPGNKGMVNCHHLAFKDSNISKLWLS